MNEVAESVLRVLTAVRNNKISTADARTSIGRQAQKAHRAMKGKSDERIAFDILTDAAEAYFRVIETHADEPLRKFDAALEAIQRKAERV